METLKFTGNFSYLELSDDSIYLKEDNVLHGGLPVFDDVPLSSILTVGPDTATADYTVPDDIHLVEKLVSQLRSNWGVSRELEIKLRGYVDSEGISKHAKILLEVLAEHIEHCGHYLSKDNAIQKLLKSICTVHYGVFNNHYKNYALNVQLDRPLNGSSGRYGDLLNVFTGKQKYSRNWFRFRGYTCMAMPGLLCVEDIVTRKEMPIVMVTVKPELVSYVRKCLFLEQDIHPDAYTIQVRKGFDTKEFPYKGLRSAYRKYILTPAKAAGVQIKEVDNIALIPVTNAPKTESRVVTSVLSAEKNHFNAFLDDLVLREVLKATSDIHLLL